MYDDGMTTCFGSVQVESSPSSVIFTPMYFVLLVIYLNGFPMALVIMHDV